MYSCGTCFSDVITDDDDGDDATSIFSVVFVNDKLTCQDPIEAPYYITFSDPLCFYCGSEVDLQTLNDTYPLCQMCKDGGKEARKKNTRAFAPRAE